MSFLPPVCICSHEGADVEKGEGMCVSKSSQKLPRAYKEHVFNKKEKHYILNVIFKFICILVLF